MGFATTLHAVESKDVGDTEIIIETKISQSAKKPGAQPDLLSAPKLVVLDGQPAQIRVTNDKAIALAGRDDARQEFETGVILNISASIDGDRILVHGVLEVSEQEGKPHATAGGAQWIELRVTRIPFIANAENGKPFELKCASPKDPRSMLTVQFKATRAPKQPATPDAN